MAKYTAIDRHAADQQRLGLRADGVGHVDDGDEERQHHVALDLVLEGADEEGRDHGAGKPEEQPRQAMPQPARDRLLGSLAGPRGAGEVPAEPGHVFVVLGQERSEQAPGRDEPDELPPVACDGEARFTMTHELPGGELLRRARPHDVPPARHPRKPLPPPRGSTESCCAPRRAGPVARADAAGGTGAPVGVTTDAPRRREREHG